MYKIAMRVISSDETNLISKLENSEITLGYENKREQSGLISGYCDEVIVDEKGNLKEFRILVPEFDTCGRIKKHYVPEWRIYNTFGFTTDQIKNKYVSIDRKTLDIKVNIL